MRVVLIIFATAIIVMIGVMASTMNLRAPMQAVKAVVQPPFEARSVDQRLMAQGLKRGTPVFMRIFKQEGELELWMLKGAHYVLFRNYPICYWSGALGPKLKEGDGQSPEGFYQVQLDQLNPNSRYHLSFNLGFPNAYDRAHERTGSYLMVHGGCVSIGCYAMTDAQIEEIYQLGEAALHNGQVAFQVHIFPFRMTEENLVAHQSSRWIEFWRNLRQGYDAFENGHQPPKVSVVGKRYRIAEVGG